MGRITEETRAILPLTWDALSRDSAVGDSTLTRRVNAAEAEVFGAAIDDTAEDALDDLVVEYVANLAALKIIPSGIDFWMVQSETETTQGPTEVVSYPDRIESLKELKKDILGTLARLEARVAPLIPAMRSRQSVPRLSSIDDELLTPNPNDLGAPYAEIEA